MEDGAEEGHAVDVVDVEDVEHGDAEEGAVTRTTSAQYHAGSISTATAPASAVTNAPVVRARRRWVVGKISQSNRTARNL